MEHSQSLGVSCFLMDVITVNWLRVELSFFFGTLLRVYVSSSSLYGQLISSERSPSVSYMMVRGENNEVLQFTIQTSLNLIFSLKFLHSHSLQCFQIWNLSD